jgi:hypothetical protein
MLTRLLPLARRLNGCCRRAEGAEDGLVSKGLSGDAKVSALLSKLMDDDRVRRCLNFAG